MRKSLAALCVAAALVPPLCAAAQAPPPDFAGPGRPTPSPEVQAKLDAARAAAKAAAFNALSTDHAAKIQAIVDQFDAAGSKLALSDAASQIDAVLTPSESAAALDQEKQFRSAMRAAFAGGGPGGPPGGGGFPGRGEGRRRRQADAGRFFLQVDATPERFRDAMRAERGGDGPPPPPQ